MERERMAESCYEVSFELIIGRYSVQMLERINFASTAFDIIGRSESTAATKNSVKRKKMDENKGTDSTNN